MLVTAARLRYDQAATSEQGLPARHNTRAALPGLGSHTSGRGRRGLGKGSMAGTRKLDVPALKTGLWDAACQIRGPLDAPKFKDYILPLIFLKRLSDVFDDEVNRLGTEFGSREMAAQLIDD